MSNDHARTNWKQVRVLASLLTGLCYLGKHMIRIGLKHDGDYRFCRAEDENPEHHLCCNL